MPLAFRDEGYTVTLLMNRKITTIAKDNGIRVFTIAVIANCAFSILLLAWPASLTIDGCC